MDAGATIFPSILDKPLKKLTEEDISQLTREDCRKFLKEKGMRRPSWNKSQAIDQVISLKRLLEPSDDDDSGSGTARKIVFASTPENTPNGNSNVSGPDKVPEGDAEETALPAREELQGAGLSVEKLTVAGNNEKALSPRGCATIGSVGQLTIFYCGTVNVYNGVPPDKANAIMQLAASPFHFPQESPFNRSKSVSLFPCHSQNDKDVFAPIDATFSQVARADMMVEYPVSLQHREKGSTAHDTGKTQRFRQAEKFCCKNILKNQKTGITSSSSEMYLNYQVKAHASIGNWSCSSPNSPPQPGPIIRMQQKR